MIRALIFATLWMSAAAIGAPLTPLAPMPAQQTAAPAMAEPDYGIAIRDKPALPPNFSHLPYANPNAPKGGSISLGFLGTFDSLNPFNLLSGSTSQGLRGNVYQTLLMRSYDEPYTLYGLIADRVETDAARDFVTFHINPLARFSDHTPITAQDVLFTFNLLKKKGRPPQRFAYGLIKSVAILDPHTIRFDLTGIHDREMPLTLGLMPVLSAKATDAARFPEASLKPMLGSGPYKIAKVDPGKELVLQRDPDYWGKDLPINRGLYNFDTLHLLYYRDADTMFEAFQAGLLDYREEVDPTHWTTGYNFPAMRDGRMFHEAVNIGGPKGLEGFVFNTRHPMFQDVRVREALSLLFDFQWVNKVLFDGLYTRTDSFYAGSALASTGHPASADELALLHQLGAQVRPDFLAGTWRPPVSDGSGRDRALARKAYDLLKEAGYTIQNGVLTKNGQPLRFEIMVTNTSQQRLALFFAQSMQRLGVDARVRQVDEVQYQRRRQSFDFDMMLGSWISSASPGAEQRGRWSSAAASSNGSFNLAGVRSPVIDHLIDDILAAKTDAQFQTVVRAYDRVLLSGFYVVPLYHRAQMWIGASSRLAHPREWPKFGQPEFEATLDNWWIRQKPGTVAGGQYPKLKKP